MIGKKIKVVVMFGGRSPEHDVSVITGIQALNALDPALYDAMPLYIATDGQWLIGDALRQRSFYMPSAAQRNEVQAVNLQIGAEARPCLLTQPNNFWQRPQKIEFDVALLAFHGLIGEDGGLQGLLEAANVPYTGMRLMASAVMMDKAATKRILAGTEVPVLPFVEIKRPQQGLMLTVEELAPLVGDFPFPCCIKPAHLGSSIGVAGVKNIQEAADMLPTIFRYDDTAILEPFVENLIEYNVSVSQKAGQVRLSAIERPKRATELLDFKTKYLSGGGKTGNKTGGTKTGGRASEGMLSLTRDINPEISAELKTNISRWAAQVFSEVAGSGAPRLDFIGNAVTGEVWFNEANPCPGSFGYFLWEAASEPLLFTELLDHLIQEALDFHQKRQLPPDPTPVDARLFPRRS